MLILKEMIRLLNDEEGLTTVEYAIAGALVASAVVLAFSNLGVQVGGRVQDLATVVETGAPIAAPAPAPAP
ncbi:Flp family type IVb pilin [Oceanisphaera arctica]|uniref:Pilus assembly protein n=1 Tax=Oceanisphaera arctica TaxID=641510 RepID=A0A2P5TJD5_9GAMM|nr:pilus assembly protein [Oceanisphaera arctica]PPL15073.1 pilus assembly protein [Oceanisphaera arctica]GHA17609.1 hypothetical protein GCM10007082_17920 [Oceanisphaera arctica]